MHQLLDIKKTVKEKLPEWSKINIEDINLERMTGITN